MSTLHARGQTTLTNKRGILLRLCNTEFHHLVNDKEGCFQFMFYGSILEIKMLHKSEEYYCLVAELLLGIAFIHHDIAYS